MPFHLPNSYTRRGDVGRRVSDVTDSGFPETWSETRCINSRQLLQEETPLGGANRGSRWPCGLQGPHLDPGYTHPSDRHQRPPDGVAKEWNALSVPEESTAMSTVRRSRNRGWSGGRRVPDQVAQHEAFKGSTALSTLQGSTRTSGLVDQEADSLTNSFLYTDL